MRTIPKEESLDIEFKSDLKCYPDHDLIEEIDWNDKYGRGMFIPWR